MQTMNNCSWFVQLRFLTVALVLFGVSAGCGAGEIPSEYKSFFALPATQERKEFHKYSLEKQIDIHLIAATYFRPPNYGFSYDIAARGKEAIPPLLTRLKADSEEAHREAIIYVFRDMAKFHYDFRNEKDTVEALKEFVNSMKGPFYREESERLLKEILSAPKKSDTSLP